MARNLHIPISRFFHHNIPAVVNPCFSFLRSDKSASVEQNIHSANVDRCNIRTARAEDLTVLADILADSFHPRTGIIRWAYPVLRLGIYEDLRNRLRSTSPHYACFVAVTNPANALDSTGELAGTVELELRSSSSWQFRNLPYPYISNLAVRKSSRRQGIAQKLLLACEQVVLEWGFQDLYLHVLENNHQARQLYFKTGYQLRQAEPSYSIWLWQHPKRLFLHKPLVSTRISSAKP
jgi:ribosomal protein S18 acetylase RimI-like enzyme